MSFNLETLKKENKIKDKKTPKAIEDEPKKISAKGGNTPKIKKTNVCLKDL